MSYSFKVDTEVVEAPTLAPREVALPRATTGHMSFRLVGPAVLCADLVIIVLASVLSGLCYESFFLGEIRNVETFLAVGVLVCANFSALTSAQQNYRVTQLINFGRQLRYLTFTWWFICFVLLSVAFTLKISGNFSRGATLLFFGTGWLALIAFRVVLARHLARALATGGFSERKIILLTQAGQRAGSRALLDMQKCGYVPIKTYEFTKAEIEGPGGSRSLQAKIDDVVTMTQQESIDSVVLLVKWNHRHFIDNMVRMLGILPIPVHLLPDDSVAQLLTNRTASVGTAWTLELQRAPLSHAEQFYKRVFDLFVASIAIVLLSPVLAFTALLIKLDSRGPILFAQKRNGFNGRAFVIYKFRTMHVAEDGDVITQAKRHDPRVTRVGAWLRRASIDELPQLFNVLIGNMSLVGPRPHALAHNTEYQKLVANYAFRHHMKPGITGWAQVNGYRGETQTVDLMEMRIEHDLWYINHWTFWLDLRILLKTLSLAYRQTNAY